MIRNFYSAASKLLLRGRGPRQRPTSGVYLQVQPKEKGGSEVCRVQRAFIDNISDTEQESDAAILISRYPEKIG